MLFKPFFKAIITLSALLLFVSSSAWAAFGEDIERPRPKFTQEGSDYIAELIPRGKSTRIQIRFHAEGGTIAEVSPKVFTEAETPKIDIKNYRSGFYQIDLIPEKAGGEVRLSLSSTYFNSATDIWAVTERATRTWGTTHVSNRRMADKGAALDFTVRDGSLLDEDGTANGRIQVFVGPRDDFWGYAIGTLVIRFFGVFLVLGILMIGMIVSGRLFQSMGKGRQTAKTPAADLMLPGDDPVLPVVPDPASGVTPQMAAAIGLALHLHARGSARGNAGVLPAAESRGQAESNWSLSGRNQMMADRMAAFGRVH